MIKCALLANSNISLPFLNLPVTHEINDLYDVYLICDETGTSLLIPHIAKKPYQVDFASDKMAYRQAQLASQKELIVKACKIKGLARPCKILDATAGFGRDAFILAASGAEVTVIERNPIVATLLQDGINRIQDETLKNRLTLIHADSQQFLTNLAENIDKPDVIYLDPMFEEERNAKVKKDLQLLQFLLQEDTSDQAKLLSLALKACQSQVVVKRAIHAPPLDNQTPSFCFTGKHSRFDVYKN